MQVGTIIGYPLTAAIIDNLGWKAVFYIKAILVIVWCLLWFLVITDKPEDFKWITDEEKNYIRKSTSSGKEKTKVRLLTL